MSNEQDVFSFDLNESLYFERGQEVSQMLGISLEPEISIQSFNEYVSIRGVIELHGEYEAAQLNVEPEERSLDFDDHHSRRYFEQTNSEENGLVTFSHRFPVEISVPSYRVDDMNDIKVSVSSFDYEILEDHQLRLTSTIAIHGISNESVLPDEINERIENEQKLETLDENFQFELKDELLHDRKDKEVKEDDEEKVPERMEKEKVEIDHDEEDVDKDRWKYKQTQSLEEFFKTDEAAENITGTKDEEHVTAELDVQEESEDHDTSERKPSYLADLFSDVDFEEDTKYEQMRICIVQDQDTLESISERYQIPKLQLLKLNKLADDDLAKGQLLTIPPKKEK